MKAGVTSLKSGNTQKGYDRALAIFNMFLNHIKHDKKVVEECTEAFLCDSDMFDKFSRFLLEDYEGDLTDGILKSGTGVQYLSGVKEYVRKRYPENDLWKDEEWYKSIRACLTYLLNKARMMKGLSCSDKAYPLCRCDIQEICRYLYQQNKKADLTVLLQVCLQRQAIGRANEVTKITWKSLFFDGSTNAVTTDWSQEKTGVQDLMSFINDKESFVMCPLHAIAAYAVASDSFTRENQFVFPKSMAQVSTWLRKNKKNITCLSTVEDKVYSNTFHHMCQIDTKSVNLTLTLMIQNDTISVH